MSIDSDNDEVDIELIEVLVALVRVVSRMRMLQAQDDPSSAALLTRAHAVVPVVNSIVLAVDRESRDAGPDARFMSIDLWDCQRPVAVASCA